MLDTTSLIAIALALSMDAFAVAVMASVTLESITPRHLFRLAFHFGLFQAIMPAIGWAAGRSFEASIRAWDHWVAFGILLGIGARAIWNAARAGERERPPSDPTRGLTLVGLSVATSIDALAVGFTFSLLGVSILLPVVVIGLVAAAMTLAGMLLGRRLGSLFGKSAEIAGGAILIGIGIKILVEHLCAG
ncbi:MAG: manganese efflux pump [Planctomycetes bacterium]|nr:manganese efflux pump [Planctomycetota bacterium]